jgi:hypothetical protein
MIEIGHLRQVRDVDADMGELQIDGLRHGDAASSCTRKNLAQGRLARKCAARAGDRGTGNAGALATH